MRAVPGQPIVIGRGPDGVHEQVDTDGVSSQHCELLLTDAGLTVRDLNSTNGTTVNGQAVPRGGTAPVRVGHVIGLGRHATFRVEAHHLRTVAAQPNQAAAPSPPPPPAAPPPSTQASVAANVAKATEIKVVVQQEPPPPPQPPPARPAVSASGLSSAFGAVCLIILVLVLIVRRPSRAHMVNDICERETQGKLLNKIGCRLAADSGGFQYESYAVFSVVSHEDFRWVGVFDRTFRAR